MYRCPLTPNTRILAGSILRNRFAGIGGCFSPRCGLVPNKNQTAQVSAEHGVQSDLEKLVHLLLCQGAAFYGCGFRLPIGSPLFLFHLAARSASDNALIKTPPTTLRATKLICLPVLVSYQSESGTRSGVSLAHL